MQQLKSGLQITFVNIFLSKSYWKIEQRIISYAGRLFSTSAAVCCSARSFSITKLKRFKSTNTKTLSGDLSIKKEIACSRLRNIGILAHVDAGKTTITERILFYSGVTRHVGDVDDGDTVTDYMAQERERGITITAASVTLGWRNHTMNLIDTPGHVDFTVEVERCLCALDGAVTILDSSAGVEAQTKTVWHQADRYKVPRIIFLNKMDKQNSDFNGSIESVICKLKIRPLVIHHPIYFNSEFVGLVDLIRMRSFIWDRVKNSSGALYETSDIMSNNVGTLLSDATTARRKLVEEIADLDDAVAEAVLTANNYDTISASVLNAGLRRICLKQDGFPVLCGSAHLNIGIQPLMDAVIDFLPNPFDVSKRNVEFHGGNFCGLAFKIVFDTQRGFLTFLRVYTGELEPNQKVFNVNQKQSEKISRLYIAYANEFKEIDKATPGMIVVISGLKTTLTGDTLVPSQSAASVAQKQFDAVALHDSVELKTNEPLLGGLVIPQPVFFCSIEPASLAHQKNLDLALECLKREDPSLKVSVDSTSGQTILSGMGELHLDIIQNRIRNDFKVDAELGPLQVSYKETVGCSNEHSLCFEKTLQNAKNKILITLSVHPQDNLEPVVKWIHTKDNQELYSKLREAHLNSAVKGVKMALQHGPLLGYPVVQVQVGLHWLEVQPGTSNAMIAAAASQCFFEVLKSSSPRLLEPHMRIEVVTEPLHLHRILGDLTLRRAQIIDVGARSDLKEVHALVPLSELKGYSTALRVVSSGLANIVMEFDSYKVMSSEEQKNAIASVTGFL